VKKLTEFAGSICLITVVLLIRCPNLRPDLSPVVRSVGAAFGLYPKSENSEVTKKNPSFHFAPTTDEVATRALVHGMSSK